MRILQHVSGRAYTRSALVVSLALSFAQFGFSATERTLGPATVTRKPSPPVAALPAPAAAGPLRILVVDDDWSDNNSIVGDTRTSVSDRFFQACVTAATGDDKAAWSVDHVPTGADGPTLERLQPFNLILWYTGASYGGNPDNTSVLSMRDEKTVRQYLAQTGGVVVLISPGYISKVLDTASSMDDSSWPFLSEVIGVRGGVGLAQRFVAGTAVGSSGTRYSITAGNGALETQFSVVNPDGASVLFTTVPVATKPGTKPAAVATAFPFGKGRMIYIGFTLENVAADQALVAFQEILNATGLTSTVLSPRATAPVKTLPAVVQSDSVLRSTSPTQVVDAAQTFSLQGSDRQSFNFYASKEGAIRLQVQVTGAPVEVTLFHPDGRMKAQTGQGSFVVTDRVDAADLARGHVWAVSVRLSSPSPNRSVVASGSIIVSHPPSDETAVRAQLAAAKPKTTVLGKAPPLRIVSTLPEALQVSNVTRPVARPPLSAITAPVVPVKRLPVLQTVPAPVAIIEVAGAPGGWPVAADVVGVRQPLYVRGTDLFPPGISTEELNSHPQLYGAELHFEYGDGQVATIPMAVQSGWGRTLYFGRVPPIPGAVDVPISVFLKTADGRTSNRSTLVYRPWITTKTVGLPIVDYNVVNNVQTAPFNFLDWIWGYKTSLDPDFRLYDSTLDASYPDAHVAAAVLIRDTYLFGFHGDDVFYKTLQLKNGWTTVSAKVNLRDSKYAGAEVVEFTPGSSSLYCKVRWYLDPTFLDPSKLTYHVEITIQGPADFPPL